METTQTVKQTEFGLPVIIRHDYGGKQLEKIHSYVEKSAEFVEPYINGGDEVLDVGAGDGHMGVALGKYKICKYHPIDKHPVGAVEEMDWYNLPSDWTGRFDFVISNHSLEHADSPMRVMEQITRVIKPNGFLFVAVPDVQSRWGYELYESTTHYACFTREFLRTMVSRFGFVILTSQHKEFREGYREIWLLAQKMAK